MVCDATYFIQYLADFLEVASFQDVAVNGLQVEGKQKISSIATAVTSSLFVIQKARALGVDALITHHGLILRDVHLPIVAATKEKIGLLLKGDINLFTYHLPLDAHKEVGNNWAVAKRCNWQDVRPFGLYNGRYLGILATFSPLPVDQLRKDLELLYQAPARCALGGKEMVSSCAIISGGAHKFLKDAIALDADCFVTGTGDEPSWHEAFEGKIHFMAFGHAATEKIGVQLLGDHLHKHFGVSHQFIDEPNPF